MKVRDIVLEPSKIYVNDNFILKFKSDWSWEEVKENFTYETLKEKEFKEIGGK